MPQPHVVIVGAGLSGLSCAYHLEQAGISSTLLEKGSHVGGRIRTDVVDGYLLDRGFQVLQTAYPEAASIFDYDALKLKPFYRGSLIRFRGQFHKLSDPFRHMWEAVKEQTSPLITWKDRWQLLKLRAQLKKLDYEEAFTLPERSSHAFICDCGFSETFSQSFLRPFLRGVFLEQELSTSCRVLQYVLKTFMTGPAVLPAHGMIALPEQLAKRMETAEIRTECAVKEVKPGAVILENGETVSGSAIVIATDGNTAGQLLREHDPGPPHSVTCLYFVEEDVPFLGPYLVLNGEGEGPVNHMCLPNAVAPSYAPGGTTLISISVVNPKWQEREDLHDEVLKQMTDWFGSRAQNWRHLKTYHVPHALPNQEFRKRCSPVGCEGIYLAGELCEGASIQGSLVSGRKTATAVVDWLTHRND